MLPLLSNLIAKTKPFEGDEVFRTTSPTGEKIEVATLKGLEKIFSNTVTVALGFAGIVLFIMLIVGGFRYITSGGDPKNVEAARKTLTYAIGGIVLIALAFLILRFIEVFTGAPVTEFKIFQP